LTLVTLTTAKEITHMPPDPREVEDLVKTALEDMSEEHKKYTLFSTRLPVVGRR
jgi:hypothetical protein